MAYPIAVIPSRVWLNSKNGRKASIYGAAPYWSEAEKPDWTIVEQGFTVEMSDGTIGCGRRPFPTREAAVEFANKWRVNLWKLPPLGE